MSGGAIGDAIIGIAAIVIMASLIAALLPNIFSVATSISSTTGEAGELARTSVTIINYDIPTASTLQFDVLNNGKTSLPSSRINMTAAYLGNESMPSTLLALNGASSELRWTYTMTGTDDVWGPGETISIIVASPGYSFEPGNYRLKMVLYNNAICQQTFTIKG